jgi:hypothetical protein
MYSRSEFYTCKHNFIAMTYVAEGLEIPWRQAATLPAVVSGQGHSTCHYASNFVLVQEKENHVYLKILH